MSRGLCVRFESTHTRRILPPENCASTACGFAFLPSPCRFCASSSSGRANWFAREELRSQLWDSDTFVDFDHGLNAAVNRLRDALHDSADNPRFVETLPRRGYRFIGELDNAESAAALVRPWRWHRWVAPGALALAAIAIIAAILALQARRSALPAARSLRIVPFHEPDRAGGGARLLPGWYADRVRLDGGERAGTRQV